MMNLGTYTARVGKEELCVLGFPGGSEGKVSAYKYGRPGFDPWVGEIPQIGNGYPLQYSCLENPMDRGGDCNQMTRLVLRF